MVQAISETIELKDIMCGDEAAAVRHTLDIKYPVENGIVRNWDDMEHLWNYTFYEKMQVSVLCSLCVGGVLGVCGVLIRAPDGAACLLGLIVCLLLLLLLFLVLVVFVAGCVYKVVLGLPLG